MIPGTLALRQTPTWQRELAQAITDPAELIKALALDESLTASAQEAARLFPLRVPRAFVARMRAGDVHDPLLRQVLPLADECQMTPEFISDPVGDCAAMVAPGVLHKYHGRVLLTVTGACAVHCRYCFRRGFPYAEANPMADAWRGALDYIRADATLTEVILSGGDPLTLSDSRLTELVRGLEAIPHVRRLRLHTRLPIVLPARVDEKLLAWMQATRFTLVVVVHVNHANEIDINVRTALRLLQVSGATLLNQSVLLRGVNDDVETLVTLSEELFDVGVVPYYLHLLDRVAGAAHFDVSADRARHLWTGLHSRLSGYLVPRLVRETPGELGKTVW